MGVPESIRKVARPKNTIVEDKKGNGPKRFAVRERKGYRYAPGRNPSPCNGRVIGHIIDCRFVPVVRREKPAALFYGTAAHYGRTFLREFYPGAALSANTVGKGKRSTGGKAGYHGTWCCLIAEQRAARNPWLKMRMPPSLKEDARGKGEGQ